jgi:hypothetical protein
MVLPEWDYLEPGFRKEILSYVADGGNLIIIGPKASALFSEELGVQFSCDLEPEATLWIEQDGLLGGLSRNPFQSIKILNNHAVPFGKLYTDNDLTGPNQIAATWIPYGNGKLAATYVNLGERYAHGENYVVRRFFHKLVQECFPAPMVEVVGSHKVDVSLGKKEEKILINLVNTSGPHGDPDVYTFDEIPPVGPLVVKLRLPATPKRVVLQPSANEIPFTILGNQVELIIPRLDIYTIIEISL